MFLHLGKYNDVQKEIFRPKKQQKLLKIGAKETSENDESQREIVTFN